MEKASSTEVTEWELHRNQVLYQLQGNRNPFVDFPQWAKMIDFTEGWQKE
jgi:endonuclease G